MISTLCGVVESEAFNAPRAPRRPEAHSMAERPHLYAARPAPASPSRARSTLGVLTNVIAPSIFIAFKTTLLAIVSKGILYHQLSSVRVWGWVRVGALHTPFSTEGEAVCIYRAKEALECPPECFQLGGLPERSEGGEEARMAGPLGADAQSSLVLEYARLF